MATIRGSNKADVLTGTASADKIQGQSGNDIIDARDGNDSIDAGSGDDRIVSGSGSDTIDGGLGIDTLDYSGWSGRISVQYGGYATSTNGVGSVEEIDASGSLRSTDQFSGIENIIATAGNDLVYGGGGDNGLWGGAGDDRLNAAGGNDTIHGGAGDDLIDVGNGNDIVDGGDGIDTLFWDWSAHLRVVLDLQAGRIDYPGYAGENFDIILNFENVRGRDGTKEIYGTDGSNMVQGGNGSDLIDGRGGDDVLVGDHGRYFGTGGSSLGYDDTIRGGAGNDLLSGDYGSDVLAGGSGADIFVVDTYYGNDRITDFEDGVDKLALFGGLTITGWEGRDTNGDGVVDAQAALLSSGQALLFDGATAASSLVDGSGVVLHGEQFAVPELAEWSAGTGASWDSTTQSTLYQDALTTTASAFAAGGISIMANQSDGIAARPGSGGGGGGGGGGKSISVSGTRGNDAIAVNSDHITVNGTAKFYDATLIAKGVTLAGKEGDDTISGGSGADKIDGGAGKDTLTGGAGLDTLLGGSGNDTLVDLDLLVLDSDPDDGVDPNANSGAIFNGGLGIDTIDFSGATTSVGISLEGVVWLGLQVGNYTAQADGSIYGRISGVENLIGGSGNDWLAGDNGDNEIWGGGGDDLLFGGATQPSSDTLHGGDGDDALWGGFGNDVLEGGAGVDLLGVSGLGFGNDVILDFNTAEDQVELNLLSEVPAWSATTYNGQDSSLATFSDGSSILFAGITDPSQIAINYT